MILSNEKYQLTITDLWDWALQNCSFPQYTSCCHDNTSGQTLCSLLSSSIITHFIVYCPYHLLSGSEGGNTRLIAATKDAGLNAKVVYNDSPSVLLHATQKQQGNQSAMHYKNKKEIKVRVTQKQKRNQSAILRIVRIRLTPHPLSFIPPVGSSISTIQMLKKLALTLHATSSHVSQKIMKALLKSSKSS